jgi:hypothetical protein
VPFTENHQYVDRDLNLSITHQGVQATVHCSASGDLLRSRVSSTFSLGRTTVWVDTEGTSGRGGIGHKHRAVQTRPLPIAVTIKTPDGQPFTRAALIISQASPTAIAEAARVSRQVVYGSRTIPRRPRR